MINSSKWWQPDHLQINQDNKFIKYSLLLIHKRQVYLWLIIGFIALKDLRKVAKDLGELTDDNVLQEMIERADFDGDTVVSEDEFYNLLTKKVYWETKYS